MEWSANMNLDIFDFVEEESNVVEFPLRLTLPIKESKKPDKPNKPKKPKEIETPKVDISTKEELMKVADFVYKANQQFYNEVGGYFNIPNETFNFIMCEMIKSDGTRCKFPLASKVLALYSLFAKSMQNSHGEGNRNLKMQYENSCYWKMTDIYKYFEVDHRVIEECVEILIHNGLIVRKVSTEFGIQPKYYFYVLLVPNKEFTIEHSDNKISRPKAFGN